MALAQPPHLLILLVCMTYMVFSITAHPPGLAGSTYCARDVDSEPSYCFWGISGAAYRMRSVERSAEEIANVEANFVQTRSEELDLFVDNKSSTPNCLRTRDGQATCLTSAFAWRKVEASNQAVYCFSGTAELVARSKDISLFEASSETEDLEGEKSLYEKGDIVMMCDFDDSTNTTQCTRAGYYCAANGRFKGKKHNLHWGRQGVRNCKGLNSKPPCCVWKASIFCQRPLDHFEQLLDPAITEPTTATDLVSRDVEMSNVFGVNNYAMNCFDSSYATKVCLDKGYYCDSSGKLVHKKDGKEDKACDKEWCSCINLNPMPKCYYKAAGVLRCLKTELKTTLWVDLPYAEASSDQYKALDTRSEDLGQEENDTSVSEFETSTEVSKSDSISLHNLVKRHNYAMVCWENSQMTAICNEAGYYCNKHGRLNHKKDSKDGPDCTESGGCECVNLFGQPTCFWESSGFLCLRDAVLDIATTAYTTPNKLEPRNTKAYAHPASTDFTSLAPRSTANLFKRHNYAMNCWESSVMTALCAGLGYHCNSKGEFVLQKGKKGNKDCTDDVPCICVDLFPKPKCFLQGSGVLRCITKKDSLRWLAAQASSQQDSKIVEPEPDTLATKALEQRLTTLKLEETKDDEPLLKRHDFAMSCLDNAQYTKICRDVGYYCDRNGRLNYGGKGRGLDGCWKEQECQCMSLVAKPRCYLAISGSTACVLSRRGDEMAEEVVHFDVQNLVDGSSVRPRCFVDATGHVDCREKPHVRRGDDVEDGFLEVDIVDDDEMYRSLLGRARTYSNDAVVDTDM